MKKKLFLIPCFLLSVFYLQAQAYTPRNGRLYVNQNASGSNTGYDWNNAVINLADALEYVKNNPGTVNEIWVAAGTYKPMYIPKPFGFNTIDRDKTFEIVKGLKIYGGFNGTESTPEERDWKNNLTILSGDLDNDGELSDNDAIHVVYGYNDVGSACLDGFVITGGNANINSTSSFNNKRQGGGIYLQNASPELKNLLIEKNYAGNNGGGAYLYQNSSKLTHITFQNNKSQQDGGGLFLWSCNTKCEQLNVLDNESGSNGGGIFIHYDKTAGTETVSISNALINGNTTATQGGGIRIADASPLLKNVTISNNRTDYYGGGITTGNKAVKLINVQITGNNAKYGGGMEVDGTTVVVNATVSNNTATTWGGGIYNTGGTPSYQNSIIWKNTGPYPEIYNFSASRPTYSYCIIRNSRGSGATWNSKYGTDEGNNIDTDPCFTDAESGNYSLLPYSKGVNGGNNSLYTQSGGSLTADTDLSGNPRIFNGNRGTIDIGSYEYQGNADNQVATWTFSGTTGIWDMAGSGWNGSRNDQFWNGDIVNFSGEGAGTVNIAPTGVKPADIYVSGNKDYIFSGGPVITDKSASHTTFQNRNGKLVLGKKAEGDSPTATESEAPFEGTLKLQQTNNFSEGIVINSGTLEVATPEQLGTDFNKLTFADRGTLRFTENITLNGGQSDRHRLGIMWASGEIELESGKTFTIENNVLAQGNGAVISFNSQNALGETLSFVTPDTATTTEPRFFFNANIAQSNHGGVIYNAGGIFNISNVEFRNNQVLGEAQNGGVLYASGGRTHIKNALFSGNYAKGSSRYGGGGGAILLQGSSEVNIENATFEGNKSGMYGGDIFNNESSLNLTDVSFIKNFCLLGGAFMTQGGNNTLTVTEDKTSLFSGNIVDDEGTIVNNSIFLYSSYETSNLMITTEAGALLDMRDPLAGQAGSTAYTGERTININKKGTGTWKLAGENGFSSYGNEEKGFGKTLFHIDEGTLYLYYENETENPDENDTNAKVAKATIEIAGNNSEFRLGNGINWAVIGIGGGNSIKVPEGTLRIHENSVLRFDPERNQRYGGLFISAAHCELKTNDDKPTFSIDLENWKEGEYILITADEDVFGSIDFADATVTVAGNPIHEKLSAVLSAQDNGKKLVITNTRLLTTDNITVEPIDPQVYTGRAITPEPVVKDTTEILVKDTDYSLSYTGNTDAGEATVTITGKGRYSGEINVSFRINKADPVITWPASAKITYGESLAEAVFTGESGDGSFAFRDGALKPAVSNSEITEYVLIFTPTDTANYTPAEKADMKVTVDKARLTVTARALSMPYGTDPVNFQAGDAYDITGFVNQENEAVLSEKPKVKLTSSITASSPAGTYNEAVEVAGASAANYDFTYHFNTLTITQAESGHITFDPIPSKVYGDAPFNLSGRHALGKPLTYESDNSIVTVQNTGQSWQATINGAGTVTLTVRFAGDNDVEAESVTQTLTIGKAGLTVTARDQERLFGEANPDIRSAYDFSQFIHSTDANLFTTLPQAMIDPQYGSDAPAGTYPGGVWVTGGEHPYYQLNYVPGTLTIKPASGDIYFPVIGNKTYGDADFNLTATHVGGNTVKYESLNPDVIELYADNGIMKGRILKAGTAGLRAYTEAENSYLAMETQQSVTVEKATLTIRPHDKQRFYGEPNPEFTLEFSGLKYNDNENSFGTITVTTTADATSPAGIYPITASGASNDNYHILYNEGILTVSSNNTAISDLNVSETTYDVELGYYVADCGINSVLVTITTEEPNSVVFYNGISGSSFTVPVNRPDIYEIKFTVQSQDRSRSEEYTIRIEKRFRFEDIVIQKWNNVLLINNNPETNNGYSFTAFTWYKNGEPTGTGSYYSAGDKASDLLDSNALYTVHLTTSDGKVLRTCEASPVMKSPSVRIYPNPVKSGHTVNVETCLPKELLDRAQLEVTGSNGTKINKQPLTGELTKLTLPSTPGIYFVRVQADNFNRTVEIIVQ